MSDVLFLAMPSHMALRADIRQLMDNLAAGSRESQKPLAARALETAAREVLQAMVVNLVKRLENPAKPNADIHRTLDSLDNHIGTFCRMLVGVLGNDRIAAALRHYQTLMIDIDDDRGQPAPWFGFRVDAAFVDELHAVAAHLRDENTAYDAQRTMALLDAVTDRVLHQFAEVPKQQMDFGFLMRKTADGGIAVIRNAMHGMGRRAIPHLSARQRRGLADHLESFVKALPADRYA